MTAELPAGPLSGGPVLCLNIDGTLTPLGYDNRYDQEAPIPGFVPVPGVGDNLQVHPALPVWVTELELAFTHCAWVSRLRGRCRRFAECAGLQGAADWPYIMPVDEPPVPGTSLSSYKLEAARAWVTPETPVAVVDDQLVEQVDYEDEDIMTLGSIASFVERPGPVLLIGPDRQIGLTRPIVDLLCRFARGPYDTAFNLRCPLKPDSDWLVQWPWPLPPAQEHPVLVRSEDEQAWGAQRKDARWKIREQQDKQRNEG